MEINDEEKKIESIDPSSEINTNTSNNDGNKSDSNDEEKNESPKESTSEKKSEVIPKDENMKEEPEKKAKKVHNFFSEYLII